MIYLYCCLQVTFWWGNHTEEHLTQQMHLPLIVFVSSQTGSKIEPYILHQNLDLLKLLCHLLSKIRHIRTSWTLPLLPLSTIRKHTKSANQKWPLLLLIKKKRQNNPHDFLLLFTTLLFHNLHLFDHFFKSSILRPAPFSSPKIVKLVLGFDFLLLHENFRTNL